MSSKTPEILISAIRQFKHNDGSDGFVIAYDEDEVNIIVEQLKKENEELKLWQQRAFDCYPNIDLDIDNLTKDKE